MISDEADGIVAGQKLVFKIIEHRYDNFHLSRMLMDLRRFYRNKLQSSIKERNAIEYKIAQCVDVNHQRLLDALSLENKMTHLSKTIDVLISWLEHDVLNKSGLRHNDREMLYDFILDEFKKLETIESHRISTVCVTLKNKKGASLSYVKELEDRLSWIAETHSIPVDWVWEMAQLQRCEFMGDGYGIRMLPLCDALGDQFDEIENEVLIALDSTERTSSAAENLNGRVRCYTSQRDHVDNNFLDLIRFYLNHSKFVSSSRSDRKNKSPREILTEKEHPHWLELLGFERFNRSAA
jgi:hypothetical protein